MQEPQETEIQQFHVQICQALTDPTRICCSIGLPKVRKT